jgi:hypothetical protein
VQQQMDNILVLSLNAGGIKSKLLYPETYNLLRQFHIVCVSESKLSNCDTVEIDGYYSFYKNRKKYKRRSGGIFVLIKESLMPYVTIFETKDNIGDMLLDDDIKRFYKQTDFALCNHCLFFKVSKEVFGEETLFCSAYFEPELSPYRNNDVFAELTSSLIHLNIDNVVICGDLNARTGNLCDILTENKFEENTENIFLPNIPSRYSKDKEVNFFGKELIDFCYMTQTVIVNGRTGTDSGIGKCTCKDASVVDYVLISGNCFDWVSKFEILDFEKMFSDAHCALTFSVKCKNWGTCEKFSEQEINLEPANPSSETLFSKQRWKQDSTTSFSHNLCDDKIIEVRDALNELLKHPSSAGLCHIDSAVSKINNILTDSAQKSMIIRSVKVNKKRASRIRKNKTKSKPWYSSACKEKSISYHFEKNKAKRTKADADLKSKDKKFKEYKKCVKYCFKKYQTDRCYKIRNLKTNDTKAYWKVLSSEDTKFEPPKPSCDTFLQFFKSMNISTVNIEPCISDNIIENEELNKDVTPEELLPCLQKLKTNKACSDDHITNEFLKHSSKKMLQIYALLFNVILNTGIVPTSWTVGTIKPIYKNKGDTNDPNNYRGITILSCFGKLFTSFLNSRLTSYIEKNKILGKEQAGFRESHSTIDHLFTIHALTDIILSEKGRLFCAFLDYEKAFDKVERSFLWQKLLTCNINGKILDVIMNMYSNAKSCVQVGNTKSNFFQTSTGVRQGENLSPLLFALFLNDLKNTLSLRMNDLNTVKETTKGLKLTESEIELLVKLFVLLYADDTIICAETPEALQEGLDCVKEYCDRWLLKLNANKCKIMIFSRGKVRNLPNWRIGDNSLEVVYSFTYLGLKLNYDNKFSVAQHDLYNRASRAMFGLLKKCNRLSLPLELSIDLFDNIVLPVMSYGCEVWGLAIKDYAQKLQVKFYKILLQLRQSTPTCMVFGEVGRPSCETAIKKRFLNFWYRLRDPEHQDKMSSVMYKFLLRLHDEKKYVSPYIQCIKTTLQQLGMNDMWLNQNSLTVGKVCFKSKIKQGLQDTFIQDWFNTIDNSSICINYRMYKTSFCSEGYLKKLPNNLVIRVARFRTTNNRLPVNTLRYVDVPRNERVCMKCEQDIGDEFHYLFCCPYFETERKEYLSPYFYRRPNALKFEQLFRGSKKKLLKLAGFVRIIHQGLA